MTTTKLEALAARLEALCLDSDDQRRGQMGPTKATLTPAEREALADRLDLMAEDAAACGDPLYITPALLNEIRAELRARGE